MDTFLRVVSPVMRELYGPYFISILEVISDKILPKLPENSNFVPSLTHKKQLEDFLTNFLGSNGSTCLPVLNDL